MCLKHEKAMANVDGSVGNREHGLILFKLEVIIVFVGIMLSMPLMIILYAKYGFVRLLGLGHFP